MAKIGETHDFYCINCGKKGIPVFRKSGQQRGRHHRKKMWCPYCQMQINHVECRNYWEKLDFEKDFANGVYVKEAEESIRVCNGGV